LRAHRIVSWKKERAMHESRPKTEDERHKRFKERVAKILREYEEKVQAARERYDKKATGPREKP